VRKLLVVVLLATLAPNASMASAGAREATATPSTHVHLDGVDVALRPGTGQVVTVKHTRGHHARVTWWIHRSHGWAKVLRARDGRTGYGGLVAGSRRRQGTGTTPLGTYRLPSAFGTHRRQDDWDLGYRRIRQGDFWVQDNGSDFYNRYRNQSKGGFRWWLPASDENSSERLTDYPAQYEFSIVTSFNHRQVRHRGAGIFLHVNGSGATGGCVSAPRWFVKALMARLDGRRVPVIAIGR
jgi:L,D-peptidoglycan transpeptidase YkuD (ErfK/YbiS/YcfS/YnhG family)